MGDIGPAQQLFEVLPTRSWTIPQPAPEPVPDPTPEPAPGPDPTPIPSAAHR